MREKNRNPIASIKKLPQFTTMNVIDGQAGLTSYSSLIFYSLTIDNILNIIVLLILAGVIATLTGENGILTRANNAKTETEEAKEDELRKLTQAEAATYLEEHEYEDPNGEKITIPAKCAVSLVEGENTLEDGLVIIDANGNEWVWIEVPENVTASSTTDEEIENALISYATNYRGSYSDTWYEGCGLEKQEYTDKYNEMLQSIKENNGFYIGRYEVGIENSYRNYGADYNTEHPITETPVIKSNAYPYNYVTCIQAQKLSENLSPDKETTSTLMFGLQWDLTCKFLESKGLSQEEIKGGDVIGSTNWGNYKNSSIVLTRGKYNTSPGSITNQWLDIEQGTKSATMLLTTGASENTNKMNIYDFAGNVHEWTLEYTNNVDSSCTYRGGCYGDDGSNNTSNVRGNYTNNDNREYVGFRPSLY